MKPRIMLNGLGLPASMACLMALMALCIAPMPAMAQDAPAQAARKPFAADPFSDPFRLGGDPFSTLSTFDPKPLMECLCRKALAAATCKPEENFNFVGEAEPPQDSAPQRRPKPRDPVKPEARVLVFSGFYGTADTQFSCQDDGQRLILSSQAWPARRITVPYTLDGDSQCALATVRAPACGAPQEISCCAGQR